MIPVAGVPDLDLARITQYCDAKVPSQHREKIRVENAARGKSVTIFECRPPWRHDSTDWTRTSVAQLRYDTDDHLWTLYFADRNRRWHRYPDADPSRINALLVEIEADPTGIFWG